MIWTIIQVSLRRLLHNRVELLLTFVVPIAFFSIFALIFGKGIGSGATPKIKVVLVDEVRSSDSQSVASALRENVGLRFMDRESATDSGAGGKSTAMTSTAMSSTAMTSEDAALMVRRGGATIGIVIKRDKDDHLRVDLLVDASDQVAGQVVSALVGRELVVNSVRQASLKRRMAASDESRTMMRRPALDEPASALIESGMDAVQVVDVLGEGKASPVISMYAAGIAVMFLLFGATGGGGVLLEERENTTLDRLLSTQLTMDHLLLGKWFYLTGLGFVQVCVMFAWGQIVFGVDLLGHLDGFVMMTLVTSSAAAAFGLFLATLCKTRGQLNGLSVILILTMSALGGSMVPRYVMSDRMREMGMWTFNAWALDGYDKVFWRDMSAGSLWPQLMVLLLAGVAFLLVARALAIRWEFD